MDYKIGDAVKLKEGFCPVMVVDSISADMVGCKWYLDKEGQFKYEDFHKDMLKHYKKKGLLDK